MNKFYAVQKFLLLFLIGATYCNAQVPALDTSFGTSGVTLTDVTTGTDAVGTIARQSDGKFIVAVVSAYNVNGNIRLLRFSENGVLDTTFGLDGIVETPIFCEGTDSKLRIAVQADDKILVTGGMKSGVSTIYKNVLTRYEADGALDSGFGDMGISGSLNIFDAESVTLLPDGSIMVLAGSSSGVRATKYLTSGYWDMGYGTNGSLSFSFTDTTDDTEWAKKIIGQPDGTVWVLAEIGKWINNELWYAPAVAKITPSGELATDFGSGGKWMGEMTKSSNTYDFVRLSDGAIVIVGDEKSQATGLRKGKITKLDASGNPVAGFGTNGVLLDTLSEGTGDTIFISALSLDDTLLVEAYRTTSSSGPDIGLVRYLQDGTLDTTFGTDGRYILDVTGGTEVVFDMHRQGDGKIVLGGQTSTSALLLRLDMGSLAIHDTTKNTITAFPNPFSNEIALAGLTSGAQVALCDLSGKVLHESYLQPDQPVWPLPQSLAKGVYLLKVTSGKANRTLKLVKS